MTNVPNGGHTPPSITDRAEQRRLNRLADVEWLATRSPMRSAEDLAAPIVQGLFGLFDATMGEALPAALMGLVEGAEFDDTIDVDRYRAELAEFVETFERVAQIVRAGIAMLIPAETMPDLVSALDPVIRAIGDTVSAETVLDGDLVRRLFEARA